TRGRSEETTPPNSTDGMARRPTRGTEAMARSPERAFRSLQWDFTTAGMGWTASLRAEKGPANRPGNLGPPARPRRLIQALGQAIPARSGRPAPAPGVLDLVPPPGL